MSGSYPTIGLYTTERRIIEAVGLDEAPEYNRGDGDSLFESSTIKLTPNFILRIKNKIEEINSWIDRDYENSLTNKFLFHTGYGEISEFWRLKGDVEILLKDLRDPLRAQSEWGYVLKSTKAAIDARFSFFGNRFWYHDSYKDKQTTPFKTSSV